MDVLVLGRNSWCGLAGSLGHSRKEGELQQGLAPTCTLQDSLLFDRSVESEDLWVEPEAAQWLDVGRPSNESQHSSKHPLIRGSWSKLAAEAARVGCDKSKVPGIESSIFSCTQQERTDMPSQGILAMPETLAAPCQGCCGCCPSNTETCEFPQKESDQTLGSTSFLSLWEVSNFGTPSCFINSEIHVC